MVTLEIRLMRLEDLPRIMEIEKKSFWSPWSERLFRQELTRNRRARYLVLQEEDLIIGYVGMWFTPGEIHITNLAVDPKYRRRGLASRLIKEVYRAAMEKKLFRITLEVRASNREARLLYRKEGFRETGTRPGYYSDNREDAVIMTRVLEGGEENGRGFNFRN